MRVLIDECLPRQLKAALGTAHDASTVHEMGWAGLKNGALLEVAEERFDALITSDQGLHHQQSFGNRNIATVVLPTNRLREVIDAVPALLQSLEVLASAQRVVIDLPANRTQWRTVRLRETIEDRGLIRHVFHDEA